MNAAAVPNATVAFESIDGPPPEVFRRLVASLNDEATARQVAVVPRQSAATYRVRGYVTALVDRDKTSFAWVWDVYDSDKRRALRISGEEPAPGHRGRNAWSVADERVLGGISRTGMERIATFLNAPDPASGSAFTLAPGLVLPALLSTRDDSPEAAGIFRIFSGSGQQAPAPQEPEAEAPKQPKRPPSAASPRQRSAAATTATRSAALAQ